MLKDIYQITIIALPVMIVTFFASEMLDNNYAEIKTLREQINELEQNCDYKLSNKIAYNVTVTTYNPTRAQCDNTPHITADGTHFKTWKATSYRYVALSRDLIARWGGPFEYGDKLRGVFYTKPDSTGKEVQREEAIDESQYTEFVKEFKGTYFEEVYNILTSYYNIGRFRLLLLEPRTSLSWHRDPEPRLHIPIFTNPGAHLCIDDRLKHLPADGRVWFTDTRNYHTVFNGGEENRIHLVATYLGKK